MKFELTRHGTVPIPVVLRAVEIASHVRIKEMKSRDRRFMVSRARMAACQVAAMVVHKSYNEIAGQMGLHHTTVLHAVKQDRVDILLIRNKALDLIWDKNNDARDTCVTKVLDLRNQLLKTTKRHSKCEK